MGHCWKRKVGMSVSFLMEYAEHVSSNGLARFGKFTRVYYEGSLAAVVVADLTDVSASLKAAAVMISSLYTYQDDCFNL